MAGNRKAAEKAPGVYVISDKSAGKFYIGSSVNVENRMRAHHSTLVRGAHHNYRLQKAFSAGHQFEYTGFGVKAGTDILELEQELLDEHFDTGRLYNIARSVEAPSLGSKPTAEANEKRRLALLGRKRPPEVGEKGPGRVAGPTYE